MNDDPAEHPKGEPKFVELRTYRYGDDLASRVDFYIDARGAFYFRRLIGSDDAGPFSFAELDRELELEQEPCKVIKLATPHES